MFEPFQISFEAFVDYGFPSRTFVMASRVPYGNFIRCQCSVSPSTFRICIWHSPELFSVYTVCIIIIIIIILLQ